MGGRQVSQKMTIQSIKHTGAPVYLGEVSGTDLPASRRKAEKKGDGVIVRLNPSSEDVRLFFDSPTPADCDDVIDPRH